MYKRQVTGTSTNPFQYTGRENDGTGLYYYRARYYSPTLQRFISEDPIGFEGGDVNFYAYVLNNPIRFQDPFGLWTAGGGGEISGGAFGAGGSFNVSVVVDGNGQVGIAVTVGGGGHGGSGLGGVSGTVQGQVTNAGSIQNLGGSGASTGIAGGTGGLVGGAGAVTGIGSGGYTGVTFGGGVGTPGIGGTGEGTNTWIWCFLNCNPPPAPPLPPVPPGPPPAPPCGRKC